MYPFETPMPEITISPISDSFSISWLLSSTKKIFVLLIGKPIGIF